MDQDLLIAELRADEGEKLTAYLDSLGLWTVGVGHLIDPKRGADPAPFGVDLRGGGIITSAQSAMLLEVDIKHKSEELDEKLPWWRNLTDNRQRVIMNMAFQMGVDGLMKFRHALMAMQNGDFNEAKRQMLDSDWAKHQTPQRAWRLADRMVAG
ncbi:MAG: glycoside hydrolase family protein [Alphaproteobacteria bacterium]|nr:glycoside hydrolase family protein [Alphaproteobacteria bacterium]